ncbi:hypothetical protein ACFQ0K_00735 [Nocardioides caeni]|uniref:Uncharacterized protein n=1 Tax=Nocardioides caeni TaxID=574700 RepID=A0A4S8NQ19_9ACTN|nr:hypothetical protein [Nocardioides caeni]THV18595.1 hypothetical protein E9934_03015 [Nocardioides caeni]
MSGARPGPWAPWRGPQGAAALGVIVTMLISRWILLAGSWFNQDDFYLSGRAYAADLTPGFLVRDTAGHVNPLQQLSYWLVAHHAPYDWGLVAALILAIQVATVVVLWLLLTRLLGERWSRVLLLALFAWAPITLATTLWWSAAMGLWPHLLCSFGAVLLLVRWQQGDARAWRATLAILGLTAIGLLWHERAVLIVPLLLGVAVALADGDDGDEGATGLAAGWRRLVAALVRFRWLWVGQALLLTGFLVAHGLLTDVEGGQSTLRQKVEVTGSFLGRNVVPGFFGGPWTGRIEGGAVVPSTWVVVVSVTLAVAVAALLLLRGGPARRWGLAVLVGYVAADLALLLSGRAGFGSIIGLDPRYSSDTIHAAVLCVALCLRGAPPRLGLPAGSPRRGRAALVGGMTALAVACWSGSALLVPAFQNKEDRAFVANLRAAMAADPTQVLLDRLAPADVVLPLVGDDSRLSRILAPLPESLRFDETSSRLRQVLDDGTLLPVDLTGFVAAEPGPDGDCGHRVDTGAVDIAFLLPLEGQVLLRVSYFTSAESVVVVSSGEWSTRFLARRGPQQVWLVLPDLPGPVEDVRLEGSGPDAVCVTALDAGLPEAP